MTGTAPNDMISREEIQSCLSEIQVELDGIKITAGMERRRRELRAERDRLLDQLLELQSA